MDEGARSHDCRQNEGQRGHQPDKWRYSQMGLFFLVLKVIHMFGVFLNYYLKLNKLVSL